MSELIFILGGTRSGKSSFAQNYAEEIADTENQRPVYIATAEAKDDEMKERIAMHRLYRASHWLTIEEPYDLPSVLSHLTEHKGPVIIDCLTLLLSNLLFKYENKERKEKQEILLKEIDTILKKIEKLDTTTLIISNEVGVGLLSPNELGRFFQETAGSSHQKIAATADKVYFMVAGIPWRVK